MHKFSTSSGKQLWYDVKNNRIDIWTPEMEAEVSPIVRFKAPTAIDASKITMYTIEMTQQCNLRCSYCCFLVIIGTDELTMQKKSRMRLCKRQLTTSIDITIKKLKK